MGDRLRAGLWRISTFPPPRDRQFPFSYFLVIAYSEFGLLPIFKFSVRGEGFLFPELDISIENRHGFAS
jgi:hypothetical protein